MSEVKLFILLIIIIGCLKPVRGCRGGVGETTTTTSTTTTRRSRNLDPVDRNLPQAWGGFEVPAKVKAKWKDWLANYNETLKQQNLETDEKYKKDRGPGSGWPDSWQGIGGGHAGDKPPPWSYRPINQGLPEFCYLPPVRGSCLGHEVKRWAYNPYTDQCVEFEYLCEGNLNNFDTQLRCLQFCMTEPVTGCDTNTNIYIDE